MTYVNWMAFTSVPFFIRTLHGAVVLVAMTFLGACQSSPDHSGPEAVATGAPSEPFLAEYEMAGGWGTVERMRIRFIADGDAFLVKRTLVASGYEYEAADVPAAPGRELRAALLAEDILTLCDAPPLTATDLHTHRYLVVAGNRGNRFQAYGASSQDDERYQRIAGLLRRCAERFIDVPDDVRQLQSDAPEDVLAAADALRREIGWQALYGAIPPERFLQARVLTERGKRGWGSHRDDYLAIGVRIGPALVPAALARLPDAEAPVRNMIYRLLQMMLEQSPDGAPPEAEWARHHPDVARRTAEAIRRAFAAGPLRSRLLKDLVRESSERSAGMEYGAARLLLTLGDKSAVDRVIDLVESEAHQGWSERLAAIDVFDVGTQVVAERLVTRLAGTDDPVVRRRLLESLDVWTCGAASDLPGDGPDDARFAEKVAGVLQPMLTEDGTRGKAADVLRKYVGGVDPAVVSAASSPVIAVRSSRTSSASSLSVRSGTSP